MPTIFVSVGTLRFAHPTIRRMFSIRLSKSQVDFRYAFASPRREAPEALKISPPYEGVGNAGRPRTRSRVCRKKHTR